MKHRVSAVKSVNHTTRSMSSELHPPENAARKVVLRVLLTTTTVAIFILTILMVVSYTLADNRHIQSRVVVGGVTCVYLVFTNILYSQKRYHLTSALLVGLYLLISVLAIWQWGINVPFALLMMSIAVTLAGILLGARYSLLTAAMLSFFILSIELLNSIGTYTPNVSWQVGAQPKLGEALGYCLLIGVLAMVSWLFGRQIERSLLQARKAEAAVFEEKKLLAVRLKERTEELRAMQLQEMQQLYRFAELGQISTALIHDVANDLSVLTLDIEDLKKHTPSVALERAVDSAHQSISYLDSLVEEVRLQLRSEEHPREFNLSQCIEAVSNHLKSRFDKAQVTLRLEINGKNPQMRLHGDPTRFSQVMTIIIKNALDAMISAGVSSKSRPVSLLVEAGERNVSIRISDWGEGVPQSRRNKIFLPFYGTKKDGMGIGLFITKTIIEAHFKGKIELTNARNPTTFTLTIPHSSKN